MIRVYTYNGILFTVVNLHLNCPIHFSCKNYLCRPVSLSSFKIVCGHYFITSRSFSFYYFHFFAIWCMVGDFNVPIKVVENGFRNVIKIKLTAYHGAKSYQHFESICNIEVYVRWIDFDLRVLCISLNRSFCGLFQGNNFVFPLKVFVTYNWETELWVLFKKRNQHFALR